MQNSENLNSIWEAGREVWNMLTSSSSLSWMLLIAIVVGAGAIFGKALGGVVRTIFAVISGVLGVFVLVYLYATLLA